MAEPLIFASSEEEVADIRSLADLQHSCCEVFLSTCEAPFDVANKQVYLGRDSSLPLHLLAKACSVFLHTGSELSSYTVRLIRSCPGCGDPTGPCPDQSCVRTDFEEQKMDWKGNPVE